MKNVACAPPPRPMVGLGPVFFVWRFGITPLVLIRLAPTWVHELVDLFVRLLDRHTAN